MEFLIGTLVGIVEVLLILGMLIIVPKKKNLQIRHLEIVEEQLKVFHERMHEERRLADSMERLVRILTNTDEPPEIVEYRSGEEEANDKN